MAPLLLKLTSILFTYSLLPLRAILSIKDVAIKLREVKGNVKGINCLGVFLISNICNNGSEVYYNTIKYILHTI